MKWWKRLTRWFEHGRKEWFVHADFQLDPGEVLEIPVLGIREVTPPGKIRQYHFEFSYGEKNCKRCKEGEVRWWKPVKKWWEHGHGGEWEVNAEFQLGPRTVLEVPILGIKEITPPAKKRRYHLRYSFYEEEVGKNQN